MNLDHARSLIRRKMNENGLVGWRLETWVGQKIEEERQDVAPTITIVTPILILAQCRRADRTLAFSEDVLLANTKDAVLDIAIHEIAHCFSTDGHGEVWKKWSVALGGSGSLAPPGLVAPKGWDWDDGVRSW